MSANELVNFSGSTLERTLDLQTDYFGSGRTLEMGFRSEQLRRLLVAIEKNESAIVMALKKDLGKAKREAHLSEIGLIKHEIRYLRRSLKKLMKTRSVPTPSYLWPSRSYRIAQPLGKVLIISPWNYPFFLSLVPLAGAIAAGNCVVIKPSEESPHSSEVLAEIIANTFTQEFVTIFLGDAKTSQKLLEQGWGHIFFTGSTQVGRLVAQAAASTLTPVTLELGGKSPAIVTKTANVAIAARRLIFGKTLNAGQTCVAPDYVLVHKDVKEQLVKLLIEQIHAQLGTNPKQNPDYGRIVSDRHFDRLVTLMEGGNVIFGGEHDPSERYLSPTLMDQIKEGSPLDQEEIFGPILPIIAYEKYDEMLQYIRSKGTPLAAYIFSEDTSEITSFQDRISFGGGCINDTVVHLSSPHLPFGGIGESGIGAYHGRHSFEIFSHFKSVLKASSNIDLAIRYLPTSALKAKMLRFLLG